MQSDPIDVVVDWLDACRNHDMPLLLSLYAPAATLYCDCTDRAYKGRQDIETYWAPRLAAAAASAFEIDELTDEGDAISLKYTGFEGKPLTVRFWIESGRIVSSLCGPSACVQSA